MQVENLTQLLASSVLIVAVTALGLVAVRPASRRVLAQAQALKRVREARTMFLLAQILIDDGEP